MSIWRNITLHKKSCCIKICFFANFIFVVSHSKIHAAVKYLERSGAIVVKKKSLLNVQ